jgi:hypothetical protein
LFQVRVGCMTKDYAARAIDRQARVMAFAEWCRQVCQMGYKMRRY